MISGMKNELLTPSVVEANYIDLCRAAFRRGRDEKGIGFDSDLAERLNWPSTYTQWLSGGRVMPIQRLCELSAFGECYLPELMRVAAESPAGPPISTASPSPPPSSSTPISRTRWRGSSWRTRQPWPGPLASWRETTET